MSIRNKLLDSRLWLVIDLIVGGWDLHAALEYYLKGELLWAMLMFAAGIMLIVVGVFLLVMTLDEKDIA